MSGELPTPDVADGGNGEGEGGEEGGPGPSSAADLEELSLPEQLQRNILGAEFLVSLFWSAANSFRHDSIVRPFPPMFVEGGGGIEPMEGPGEGQKDIEGVVSVNSNETVSISVTTRLVF